MPRTAAALLAALFTAAPAGARDPLAHTYSIVARDPATGELGVAVQSHWFQVGPIVPWAASGVGAVATQSFVKVDYGPRGLELMAAGHSAREALDKLLADDPQRDVRQVAMVDAKGRVAVWTGPSCIADAGHQTGEGYSVQANLMATAGVWPAMARAFEAARGDLAERMLAALEAAEAEGGDIRGRQSAALLVVRAESTGQPWRDRLVDLRVDDHERPLEELRRLLGIHRAYEQMNRGDDAVTEGELEAATGHYRRAAELAPEIVELPFWQAVTLFSGGHEEAALPIFREVFAREDRWVELVRRLPASGLLPDDPAKLERILATAPGGAGGAALGTRLPKPPPPKSATPETVPPPEAPKAAPPAGRDEKRPTVRVEGKLTGEGVECQAMRSDAGKLYTLTGKLQGFKTGDRVWVEGERVQFTFCMQGTTLKVVDIGRLD